MVTQPRDGTGRFQPKAGAGNGIDQDGLDGAGIIAGENNGEHGEFISPESGKTGGSDKPRKRGRPKGSGKPGRPRKEETKESIHLESLNAILFSVHTVLAAVSKTPELAISENESKQIAEAGARVASFYDLSASAKTLAWANLLMCCGMIYGTRAVEISNRLKREKAEKRQNANSVLVVPGAPHVSPAVN